MKTLKWPDKDPDEVLLYGIDWAARLGETQIVTSVWEADEDLTVGETDVSGTIATIWLSGGVAGKRHKLVNRITTTTPGEVMTQGVILCVYEA